ncbi:hypothetical protein UY3_08136 [Chelonia mydas]|uniref:Uncharacterized protein n=1 Tax=Chelonia mydas TaxID=8469 RepID=M7BRJ8_CHEMY|nr:hypothetical protein UY3_08136 [Chelonia mydas]
MEAEQDDQGGAELIGAESPGAVRCRGAGDRWRDVERYRDVNRCLRSYRYREPDLDLDGDLRRDWHRDRLQPYQDSDLREPERRHKYDRRREWDRCRDCKRRCERCRDQDWDRDRCCPASLGKGGRIGDGFLFDSTTHTGGAAGCRGVGSVSAIKSRAAEKVSGVEGSLSSTAVCTGELTCTGLDSPCGAGVDSAGAVTCPVRSSNGRGSGAGSVGGYQTDNVKPTNKKQSAPAWAASSSGPETGTSAAVVEVPVGPDAASL